MGKRGDKIGDNSMFIFRTIYYVSGGCTGLTGVTSLR